MAHSLPSEFDLHVFKRPGDDGRPDQFTIGIWDSILTVRSVCHILPLDRALEVLREFLEAAGQETAAASKIEPNHEPRTPSRGR